MDDLLVYDPNPSQVTRCACDVSFFYSPNIAYTGVDCHQLLLQLADAHDPSSHESYIKIIYDILLFII